MLTRKLAVMALSIAAAGAAIGCSASAQENARGEALFGLCTQCHGTDGAGNSDIEAPAIAGLSAWYVEAQLGKFKSGARGTHPDDLTGMRMRPMSLTLASEEDVVAVAAYVASLAPANPTPTLADGDPARGAELYQTCIACHGADGSGNQQLFSPALDHASDWYLLAQLKKFRAGVRGANPADQTGIMMRPMAMILADEQAMRDVVAYIATLSK